MSNTEGALAKLNSLEYGEAICSIIESMLQSHGTSFVALNHDLVVGVENGHSIDDQVKLCQGFFATQF